MKHTIYILLFIILGVLASFLIHAAIEIPTLYLLTSDFETYGLGLSWNFWYTLHHVIAIFLLAGGIGIGFSQGKYWWRAIYVERRYRK